MKKFVVLTTPRSGSSLLWRYLDSHPGIEGHGEMFHRPLDRTDTYTAYRRASLGRKIVHVLWLRRSVSSYLEKLYQGTSDVDAVCFKLMYHQIFPELEHWIKSNNVYIVHLIRKNTLKMVLSRRIAEKTNVYHQFVGAETTNSEHQVKVHLDPRELISDMDAARQEVTEYRNRFNDAPYCEINYEDFVKDMRGESDKILNFLDIPTHGELKVPLHKVNADSTEELIENYEEVRDALKSTVYEELL